MKRRSAAYKLVEHVWKHRHTDSWQGHHGNGLNQVMRQAVELAIRAQMAFAPDDFGRILGDFRGACWSDCERWYTLAVQVSNGSACRALEAHLRRPPYILDTGARVSVGARIRCDERWWTVTSINADRLVLCAYDGESHKPVCRKTVKRMYWLAEMGERRQRARMRRFSKSKMPGAEAESEVMP